MQKTNMSKSRYVKKPTIKKLICQKADILLIFLLQSRKPICKKPICKKSTFKKPTFKKPICQKADHKKADLSKS
jgi:hypothetical protein